MKHEMIYILLLEYDKIYIGRTSNFESVKTKHKVKLFLEKSNVNFILNVYKILL